MLNAVGGDRRIIFASKSNDLQSERIGIVIRQSKKAVGSLPLIAPLWIQISGFKVFNFSGKCNHDPCELELTEARQSSDESNGVASRAIDGNTDGYWGGK